ncbi:hypothetical protein BDQ17DRAFT_1354703 [Cyathus striatus]|nr:hypothetical protein BDQ17DRAFT_1354703 [Cyathus striatus]
MQLTSATSCQPQFGLVNFSWAWCGSYSAMAIEGLYFALSCLHEAFPANSAPFASLFVFRVFVNNRFYRTIPKIVRSSFSGHVSVAFSLFFIAMNDPKLNS